METYSIALWPGYGYVLDSFTAEGFNEMDALDNVVSRIIKEHYTAYFLTLEEMDALRMSEGLDDDHEPDGYAYIDATMNDAPYPVYLLVANMEITRIS